MTHKRQTAKPDPIPWQDREDWEQVKEFFAASTPGKSSIERISQLTAAIGEKLNGLEQKLELLCRQTCPICSDNCCSRATVWYDFRDLVYRFCSRQTLPQAQITRSEDKLCCNLTAGGCRIPRGERPFICTWYICEVQRQIIASSSSADGCENILEELRAIQGLRKELEKEYIRSLSFMT